MYDRIHRCGRELHVLTLPHVAPHCSDNRMAWPSPAKMMV